jgi:hypothetical protein
MEEFYFVIAQSLPELLRWRNRTECPLSGDHLCIR